MKTSSIPHEKPSAFLHSRSAYRLRFEAGLVLSLGVTLVFLNLPYAGRLPEVHDGLTAPPAQERIAIEEVAITHVLPPPMAEVVRVGPSPYLTFTEVPDHVAIPDAGNAFDAGLTAPLQAGTPATYVVPGPPPPPPSVAAPIEPEAEIFVAVEEMPEMLGGIARLYELLRYPEMARRANMEGRVIVEVIIERDGRPSNPTVIRSAGPMLDQAAIEAISQLVFRPGKQRNQPVRVRYAIPVTFRLVSQ